MMHATFGPMKDSRKADALLDLLKTLRSFSVIKFADGYVTMGGELIDNVVSNEEFEVVIHYELRDYENFN
jgi:hypothetical protein